MFATDAQVTRHDTLGYTPVPEVVGRIESAPQSLIDRAEEFARSEAAARERDALLVRLQPRPAEHLKWLARDLRWSV